jgi:serine/threonine protein kinase
VYPPSIFTTLGVKVESFILHGLDHRSPSLGPYEIVSLLGAGGMGEVYLARDTRLNRMVAIKTLPTDKLGDAGRKRRFIHEAQAASALNHPNIVTIYDIASEEGNDFLVMEYVRGKTMGQLIPPRGMRLDELLRYAVQTAEALTTAHAAGIVHRDLKPGNIMVTTEGHVKPLDFGLAKLTEPYQPAGEDARTRTLQADTDEGVIVGTTAFMSPEQVESKPVDARSDIFSFGAVLYEMATGVRAFKGDSKLSTLSAILRENPQPPSQVVPDVPRELDRIITRCLRKDPARRFQAMPDLKVALEELKEETGSGTAEMAVAKVAAPSLTREIQAGARNPGGRSAGSGRRVMVLPPSASKPLPPRSVPLTTYAGSQGHPSFSPDGSQVAFEWNGEKQDNWDIYVKLVDGGAPLRLTTNAAEDRAPAWSPDGRQIAFVRGGNALYSMSPLGGTERKLTDLLARDPPGHRTAIRCCSAQPKATTNPIVFSNCRWIVAQCAESPRRLRKPILAMEISTRPFPRTGGPWPSDAGLACLWAQFTCSPWQEDKLGG